MFVRRTIFLVTTDADGDAVVETPHPINGRFLQIVYEPAGSNPLADGFMASFVTLPLVTDLVSFTKASGGTKGIWHPRAATIDQVGDPALYAAAGEPVLDYHHLADERIRLTIESGGDTKSGTFYLYTG